MCCQWVNVLVGERAAGGRVCCRWVNVLLTSLMCRTFHKNFQTVHVY